jgi:hypothetical protein
MCLRGHPVSTGSELCGVCGEDVRPRCSQGHRSAPGEQFCETCGELLLATQGHHATGEEAPVLDYHSGPFTDFLAGTAEPEPELAQPELAQPELAEPELAGPEPAGPELARPEPVGLEPAGPGLAGPELAGPELARPEACDPFPAAASALAAGTAWTAQPSDQPHLAEPWRDAHADVLASLPPYRDSDPPPATPPPRRLERQGRRGRRAAVSVLALAVLAAAIATGALTLHHRRAVTAAQPSPRPVGTSASQPAKRTSPAATRPASQVPAQLATGSWTGPIPIDLPAGRGILTGLSCPQPYACYAIDSAGNVLYRATPPLPVHNWQVTARDPNGGLVAISCATVRSCLAVGKSGDAMAMSQGQWRSPSSVDTRSGAFTSVSCPLVVFCMAVDSGGNAFAYSANTRTWQPFTVGSGGGALTGVSCASPSDCVAVSSGGSVYTFDGTSWSAATRVDPGHAFTAVSCGAPGFCVAADAAGRAAVLAGRTWSVAAMGITATAMSCPAAGFCLATDGSGGAVSYRNGAWSAVRRIDGTTTLVGVSCPVLTSCTAADQQDNVLYYTSPG